MNWRYLVGAFALMMGLAACGEDGESVAATPTCEAGTLCGTSCVDTEKDSRNCGGCGIACAAGEICSDGACTTSCPGGQALCDGACHDLGTSAAHCGACGRACPEGQVCAANDCVVACPDGQAACDGGCFDLGSSTAHCGACGNACATGEVCLEGACVANCPAGQLVCDGACVDALTDRANCGACGNACDEGEACVDGACRLVCGAGLEACQDACVDTGSDRANCGACGNACDADELCVGGTCALSCAPGSTACGGACVDTDVDRANCGACGNACDADEICVEGACIASCGSWASDLCDGSCTNLQTDPRNCGACGNACADGEVCSEGVCADSCVPGSDVCADGCTDFDHDPRNCGGCGNVCPAGANGIAVCSAGTCANVCMAGYGDCNRDLGIPGSDGCETPLQMAPDHCGACGNACPSLPHAIVACTGGACGIGACETGWEDCDNDPSNGCEQQVTSDAANCGGCGIVCDEGETCIDGICEGPGAGDICDTAIDLALGPNTVNWLARGLDYFTGAPSCSTLVPRHEDIVLRYTAQSTGAVKIAVTKTQGDRTHMVVSKAPCGNVADEFRCVSDSTTNGVQTSFPATAGEVFYIYLAVTGSSDFIPNPLPVEVTEYPGAGAAGESCAAPAALVDGANSVDFTANVNDHFASPPSCNTAPPVGADVVMRYVPTYTGAAEIVVAKASGTAWYLVVDEASCGTPQEALACVYGSSSTTELRNTIRVTQGTEYFLYLTAAGTTSSTAYTPIASPVTVQINPLDCSGITPAVTSVTPAENGQAATLNDAIVVTLNEPVRTDVGQITLVGNLGTNQTITIPSPNVTFSADRKTVTIKAEGFFVSEELVTVTVSGIEHQYCGSVFPTKTWTFSAPTTPCTPGLDGLNGGRISRIPIPAAGSMITEYYVAADADPNGWVYAGGTSALLRTRKDGSAFENVGAAAGLGTAELGYTMVIDGPNIYVFKGTTSDPTVTTGLVHRISANGGASWEKVDMATFPSVPGDDIRGAAVHGGAMFLITHENTHANPTNIWSFDLAATPPATATLVQSFGANTYSYCAGLAVDASAFFTACRNGSTTSSPFKLIRIDRATGAITEVAQVPGNTSAMAVHAGDKNGDGLADYLYFQEDVEEGYFVCSPHAAAPWSSKLFDFGGGTANFGLGFDPVGNVLWAVDDDTREFVKIQ